MSDTPRVDSALKFVERGVSEEVLAQPDKWLVNVSRQLERENSKLRSALNRVTGSLGLIIGGAGAHGAGHKDNYENAKRVLDETFHDESWPE